MPAGEDVATLGRTGATLAIHLSIMNLGQSPFGESYLYCLRLASTAVALH